jgi:hypothetical protein
MRRHLACAAFILVFAAPALAQHSEEGSGSEHRGHSTVPPGGIYYSGRGGEQSAQWKTGGKPKTHPKHSSAKTIKPTPHAPRHAAAVRT